MTNRRYERGLALILMLWLACCFKANAQVAVTPAPVPKLQFLDVNGKPLAGGKVCTFQAGSTTPLTTYSESTGSSANTNPITLDSGGFANIWLTSAAYKLIVYSSVGADSNCPNAGVSQFSIDGINPGALGNTAITGTLTVSSTLGVTGKFTPTGGIVGKTDASDASAGNVGEFIRTKQATPQSLSTGVILSLGSIALTAGDWEIQGNAVFTGSSTTWTSLIVSVSTSSSATAPNDGSFENAAGINAITGTALGQTGISTPSFRVSISSPTSYFLLTSAVFGSNTCLAAGTIRARRVR